LCDFWVIVVIAQKCDFATPVLKNGIFLLPATFDEFD